MSRTNGRTRRNRFAVRVLVFFFAAFPLARVAHAQSASSDNGARSWTAEVSGGGFVEPRSGSGSGPALLLALRRQVGESPWNATLLFVGSRLSDVGYPGPNRYIIDRHWVATAAGVDYRLVARNRFSLDAGLKAAVLWSHDIQAGMIGTPGSQFGPTNWEPKPGFIGDAAATYAFAPRLALTARGGIVEHVFTDNMFSPLGGVATGGIALRW